MNSAAFWIADGESYLAEAERSARSLKIHMPGVARVLITPSVNLPPRPWEPGHRIEKRDDLFDEIIGMANLERGRPWYAYNVACFDWAARNLQAPLFEPTPDILINLDTDTFVVQPFDDLLKLLKRFDLVATHAPAARMGRTVEPVPDAFRELNIGMLAFRNSDKMRRVIKQWHERHDRHQDIYGENDQASLRETLWATEEDVRIWVAPPEYDFRFMFGGFARYPVKVLHGRSERLPIEEVARRVNRSVGMRLWKKGEL